MRQFGIVVAFILLFSPQGHAVNIVQERSTAREDLGGGGEANAEDLLIKSYLHSREFIPEERAFHLGRLTEAAADIQPVFVRLWSEELFRLTFELPTSWNRTVHQKNALTTLAGIDPEKSFQLLGTMDTPVSTSKGDFPEDVRAYAARSIFPLFWKHAGAPSLDQIRRQAQHIGDTGQYPYLAIGPILRDLGRQNDVRAELLFAEALSYYRQGSRMRTNDSEFIECLNGVWDIVPLSLRRQALQVIVAQLLEKAEPSEGKTYRARVQTEKGTAEFTNPHLRLLFGLLPRIQEIDPDWARKLTDEHPGLGQAGGASAEEKMAEAVRVEKLPGATTADVEAAEDWGFQSARLEHIQRIAGDNPDEALNLSARLSDPVLRSVGLASAAIGFNDKNPVRARSLVDEIKKGLETIKDGPGRVRALTALARAAAAVNDQQTLRDALRRAFDLGTELFQQDLDTNPGKPAYETDVFDDLGAVAELGVRTDTEYTLGYVAGLSNALLQAHLLIDVAQGLWGLQGHQRRTN